MDILFLLAYKKAKTDITNTEASDTIFMWHLVDIRSHMT